MKQPVAFTLGCDPEFVFIDRRGRVCRADTFLPKAGQIGHDGPLGELRPTPGQHEDEVVDHLTQLVRQLPNVVARRFPSRLPGGSALIPEAHSETQNLALGFHIHLGSPLPSFYHEPFLPILVSALDYFVGIPALLLEDNPRRRLGRSKYGKPSDVRLGNTVEYRTPGGFLLRHPDYARGAMGIALCVAKSLFMAWGFHRTTEADVRQKFAMPSPSVVRKFFAQPDAVCKAQSRTILPNIVKSLEKMEFFAYHQHSIRLFFRYTLLSRQFSPQLLGNW